MKKCFSFLLALTLMLAVCAAASAETITLKIAHNYDFVTIPNSVIAAARRGMASMCSLMPAIIFMTIFRNIMT